MVPWRIVPDEIVNRNSMYRNLGYTILELNRHSLIRAFHEEPEYNFPRSANLDREGLGNIAQLGIARSFLQVFAYLTSFILDEMSDFQ